MYLEFTNLEVVYRKKGENEIFYETISLDDFKTFEEYNEYISQFESFTIKECDNDFVDKMIDWDSDSNIQLSPIFFYLRDNLEESEVFPFFAWCELRYQSLINEPYENGEYLYNQFTDEYEGTFSSKEKYAECVFREIYNIPGTLNNYVDYKRVADDLFEYDYTYVDGYVFKN